MKKLLPYLSLVGILFASWGTQAQDLPIARISANCHPAAARTTLETNQIRARIGAAASWWMPENGSSAGLEIPKNSGKQLSQAASLWVGGLDANGQLKVAAQTYRQATVLGNGYWPGPLFVDSPATNVTTCNTYDRLWTLTAAEIRAHRDNHGQLGYQVPAQIAEWPAHGGHGFSPFLAPFEDLNANGAYEPQLGEYPLIKGDVATWSIYNDKGGNNHTNRTPLGFEFHELTYGFNRPGALGTSLFQEITLINRSHIRIDSTFVGIFADAKIGNPIDDFIGCDVSRSLGFVYNGDDDDEGPLGYGANPPAFGIRIFEGPLSKANDGIDNDLDGQLDENGLDCNNQPIPERIKMWFFNVFNNNITPMGNPTQGSDVWHYLTGRWKDGTSWVFGGNGYPGSSGSTNLVYRYQYPGNSDPYGFGMGGTQAAPMSAPFNWTGGNGSSTGGVNIPSSGRFVTSMGPFEMLPGAVNRFTVGWLWARASNGGAQASLQALRNNSDLINVLFQTCEIYGMNGLSVAEQAVSIPWRLFPNPANAELYLQLSGKQQYDGPIKLQLIDARGKRLRSWHEAFPTAERLPIDISELPVGMYFLQIEYAAEQQTLKLFKR